MWKVEGEKRRVWNVYEERSKERLRTFLRCGEVLGALYVQLIPYTLWAL